jgi:hypothetical protein
MSASEAGKKLELKLINNLSDQVKESVELLQTIAKKQTGIMFLWYEQRVEQPLLRVLLQVGYDCLECLEKAAKDSDFK